MASAPRWGMAPWQEVPSTSMRNQSVLAMRGPGSHETVPASTSLQMCMANAPSTPSVTPASIAIRAPRPFSSDAWNSARTSPCSSSVMPARIRRAPRSMAMWQSWPHACMRPSSSLA